ncbi:MAG: thiol peroxidase [Deltaproteobacteria bacterium]|nr:thiol peroxidase [Deltaproteobacteria bacterium]
MQERAGIVTMRGNPVTLLGPALKPGDRAPDFMLLDGSLKPVRLADFAGRTKLISVVPSLDTPVCELQTKRFQEEAAKLPPGVDVLTVSMDLPFAQSRFCSAHGTDRIRVLSDFNDASFGRAYGVLLKELRLLARALFVAGPDDVLRHVEIVPEIGNHPDYEAALARVR